MGVEQHLHDVDDNHILQKSLAILINSLKLPWWLLRALKLVGGLLFSIICLLLIRLYGSLVLKVGVGSSLSVFRTMHHPAAIEKTGSVAGSYQSLDCVKRSFVYPLFFSSSASVPCLCTFEYGVEGNIGP